MSKLCLKFDVQAVPETSETSDILETLGGQQAPYHQPICGEPEGIGVLANLDFGKQDGTNI